MGHKILKRQSKIATHQHPRIEWWSLALQVLDMLGGKFNIKTLDILFQIFNLLPTDDRKDIGCLLHDVRYGD